LAVEERRRAPCCRRRHAVVDKRFVLISGWKKTGFPVYANSTERYSRILEWAPTDGAYIDLCAAAEAKNPVRQLHDAAVQAIVCIAPLAIRFTAPGTANAIPSSGQ
jgi:hypothetical protein